MIKLELATTIKLVLGVLLAAMFSVLVIQYYSLSEQLGEAEGRVALLEGQNAILSAEKAVNEEVLKDYAEAVDILQLKLQTKKEEVNVVIKENPEWANELIPNGVTGLVCNYSDSGDVTPSGTSERLCSIR